MNFERRAILISFPRWGDNWFRRLDRLCISLQYANHACHVIHNLTKPSWSSSSFNTQKLNGNLFLICQQFYQEFSSSFYQKTVLKLFLSDNIPLLYEAPDRGSSYAGYYSKITPNFERTFSYSTLSRFRHFQLHCWFHPLIPVGKYAACHYPHQWNKANQEIEKTTRVIAEYVAPGSIKSVLDIHFWEPSSLISRTPQELRDLCYRKFEKVVAFGHRNELAWLAFLQYNRPQ